MNCHVTHVVIDRVMHNTALFIANDPKKSNYINSGKFCCGFFFDALCFTGHLRTVSSTAKENSKLHRTSIHCSLLSDFSPFWWMLFSAKKSSAFTFVNYTVNRKKHQNVFAISFTKPSRL